MLHVFTVPCPAANALEMKVEVQPSDPALHSELLALLLPLIKDKDASAKEELQQQRQADAHLRNSPGHSGVRATVRVDKHASFAGVWDRL